MPYKWKMEILTVISVWQFDELISFYCQIKFAVNINEIRG